MCLSSGVLRAHRFHPIVLCCMALTCVHAEDDPKDQPPKTRPVKVQFRETHSSNHLRPFIFRGGSLPPPDPNAPQPRSPKRFNPDPGRWDQPDAGRAATPPPGPTGPIPAPGNPGQLAPDFSVLFPSAPI